MSDAATIELEGCRKAFPGKTPGEVREALEKILAFPRDDTSPEIAHFGIQRIAKDALGRVEVKE